MLPRIAAIPRGSRFTLERLKALDVGTWLWEDEKAVFEELMINWEGAVTFDWKEVGKIDHQWIKELTHGSAENTKFPHKVDTFQILQNYQLLSKYLETNMVSNTLQNLLDCLDK